jgi:hypothetical protein
MANSIAKALVAACQKAGRPVIEPKRELGHNLITAERKHHEHRKQAGPWDSLYQHVRR